VPLADHFTWVPWLKHFMPEMFRIVRAVAPPQDGAVGCDDPSLGRFSKSLSTPAIRYFEIEVVQREIMGRYFPVSINATRNALHGLPAAVQRQRAKEHVKLLLVPDDPSESISSAMIPEYLVSSTMVDRYLEITPPVAAIMPEFQKIINEIEKAYVRGELFSAVSAACVSIERLLNDARIKLHKHNTKIKELWGKGASNAWHKNIDALRQWGYLDNGFAVELRWIYDHIRNKYLHSGPIASLPTDALRSVSAAYRLITIFLGFPPNLFDLSQGIGCLNPQDPRFIEFYLPELRSDAQGVTAASANPPNEIP
jgi:hypothetical protein